MTHPAPLAQGKTKTILPGPRPHTVWLVTADVLTGGDAARRAEIAAIGRHKTTQAANVAALLSARGIPCATLAQDGPDRLLARACAMLPLELVVRRYAFGSYLKRHPDAVLTPPKRLDCPVVEIFHKHAVATPPAVPVAEVMEEGMARDRFLRDGVWADGVYTDPYVERHADYWALHSAKAPVGPVPLITVPPVVDGETFARIAGDILLPAFFALEQAWARIVTDHGPVVLADMKMEVGLDQETGQPLLADVIDNDSWRIWPGGDPARQLDKQVFRDGGSMDQVSDNYALVADLTARFASP